MRDTAVMIVHGIQCHPRLFRWLEDGLSSRADVYNLLLPGHGGTVRDFIKADMAQWQDFADSHARKLRGEYKRVYFAGHSMGCLLGLDAAKRMPGVFDGMVLLACPLRIRLTWRYIKYNFLAALKREGGDAFVRAARLGNGVHPKSPAEYLLCGRQFAQLLMKVRAVRQKLKNPGVPLLVCQPELDEIVSGRSLDCFSGMENAEGMVLKGCGHNYYNAEAQKRILDEFQRMING